ncbi:MAG: hypothetical protein G3M70_01370 [Candidatus Nitronauta litoralis]|uniref:Nucleoside phosphorylase domain-containing protein n=1 Tax=Candidatus Nitronauta litoralis TaxID=2705533 RepID=A0A7T0BTN2_9BACT|nr:MAG: hypothetical protein G3M70_01370 [Candidatus Nitronauta litoralis]
MKAFICILAAVSDEIAGIKQRMKIERKHVWRSVTVFEGEWEGYGLLLVRTGVGSGRALDALKKALAQFPVVLVLSVGYAGGTDPELKLGDLVLADRVLRLNSTEPAGEEKSEPFRVIPLDPALVSQAMVLSCPPDTALHRGALMTVDEVVSRPEDKQALARDHQALAVDMETFDLVEHARLEAMSILSIRAISDTAQQELVDLTHLVKESGEPDFLKAGWHVLTHPGDLKHALSLRNQSRLATKNLTEFLAEFLRKLK